MKRAHVLFVAVLALEAGFTAEARAEGPDPRVADAKHRYEALDYEKCLDEIERARASPHALPERVDIALYDGLCSFALGRRDRADAAFRAALRLDPGARLPPFTSPKIVEAFDTVAAQVRAEQQPPSPQSPPPPPAPTPKPAPDEAASHGPPILTVVLGASALVAAGTGSYLALHANGLASDANSARFESDAYELGGRARSSMTGANVAFAVAGVTAAAAIVYWLVSSR